MSLPLRGLYAITSASLCADPDRLHAAAAAALRGGAVLLQYRDKQSDPASRQANARALLALCREHDAGLIINDDVDLCESIGAAGVHLGARDAPLAAARARLGPDAIVGASCGPDVARAVNAVDQGASYVAFGRFFDSRTKPDAPQAALDSLIEAGRILSVPRCAIGGVTPLNGAPLVAAGADLIAAVEGLFSDPDPVVVERIARAYSQLFVAAPH
jgi:thiamine-phosphate pyrophosphorylase